jgi:hypothetical protein
MTTELKMPALSPTMEEGTLAKWLVKEGDDVKSGDILAEIETDKATMEFEAVDEGKIAKILVPEGTDGVKVGAPIAIMAEEGESVSPSSPAGEGGAAKAAGGEGPKPDIPTSTGPSKAPVETPPASGTPAAAPHPAQAAPESPSPSRGEGQERIKASPLARRLAQAQNLDLSNIQGSGPGGRIVRADEPIVIFCRRGNSTGISPRNSSIYRPAHPSGHTNRRRPSAACRHSSRGISRSAVSTGSARSIPRHRACGRSSCSPCRRQRCYWAVCRRTPIMIR